ncbi:hypothetical protein EV421DRAFT_1272213 [Armillaria borealis]|uniref:Uncharacterized protein n=1 Tax=Armillaria borealis TaxID=47425 RepID=A0AA39MHW8_9AGAR|nr:hypothetical protein EV421DRAFT_1272213 [Armillaria borealis]
MVALLIFIPVAVSIMIILLGKSETQAVCVIMQEITYLDIQIRFVSQFYAFGYGGRHHHSLPRLGTPYVDLVLCGLLLSGSDGLAFTERSPLDILSASSARTFEVRDLCGLPLDGAVLAAGG